MKKKITLSAVILAATLMTSSLLATDVPVAIEGRIIAVEPSKSITIEIEKSKGIELGLTEIKTLTVLDPKELIDGVGTAAAAGAASGVAAASVGVVSPPESLQGSKLRDVSLVGAAVAFLSAIARASYNYLTRKPPMLIYDADNRALNNIAVISQLPVGTRVGITQKNHINSVH